MAIDHYYVDYSGGDDTGAGTKGDPWKTLQYAYTNASTPTNVGQFNVKDSAAQILTAKLTSPSWAAGDKLCVTKGYTTDEDDGGIGEIDGDATYQCLEPGDGEYFFDLKIGNSGSANVIQGVWNSGGWKVCGCEIHTTTGDGIDCNNNRVITIKGCNFNNINGRGVDTNQGVNNKITHNYFANGTNNFTQAIYASTAGNYVAWNIISIDEASDGINYAPSSGDGSTIVEHNSVFSNGGTGKGIESGWTIQATHCEVLSNIVAGFSGAGGVGIEYAGSDRAMLIANNAVSDDCTIEYSQTGDLAYDASDNSNETLTADPFKKSGADTFANRASYFEPDDIGSLHGGGFPSAIRFDKGAVQHADPAGGGGGLLRVGMSGGMFG